MTGAPLIEKLGLPTENGRLKVQTNLQVPGHPDVFAAGDAAAVPDMTQPGQDHPADRATRDSAGKGVGAQRRRQPRLRQAPRSTSTATWAWWSTSDRITPWRTRSTSSCRVSPAKAVTRAYHLYAIPRLVNRWAVSLAYLTDVFFARSVVSIGLSTRRMTQFGASEGIPLPKPD